MRVSTDRHPWVEHQFYTTSNTKRDEIEGSYYNDPPCMTTSLLYPFATPPFHLIYFDMAYLVFIILINKLLHSFVNMRTK